MNAHSASLVNGIILVVVGLWGYLESSSPTSLIPVGIGVTLLALNKGVKNQNKVIKNKKVKTNGTIDFINGQKNFLSKSIYNLNPKIGDLLIFPNYLMHAAYPFNVDGERRSFSFNAKITFKK